MLRLPRARPCHHPPGQLESLVSLLQSPTALERQIPTQNFDSEMLA